MSLLSDSSTHAGVLCHFNKRPNNIQCPRIRPLQLGRTLNIGPAYLTDVAWAHNDFSHVYLAAPIGSADPIVLVKRTTFEWGKVVQIGVAHPATFPDKQFKSKVRIWPELDIDSKVLAMSPTKHVTYDWRALADVEFGIRNNVHAAKRRGLQPKPVAVAKLGRTTVYLRKNI